MVATIGIAALPGKSNFVSGMRGDVLTDVMFPIFSSISFHPCGDTAVAVPVRHILSSDKPVIKKRIPLISKNFPIKLKGRCIQLSVTAAENIW
ncbi:hypothetical protein JOU65_004546 [Salmonella enterica]|nr:hypothetical protein [Salmonella enterica]ECK2857422.1 hypothetical protein [Salmonella enterica]ECK5188207.1 hypothetical protein [Salmonella enterica]ECR0402774.1 hypothetical protein [Salmonella enterica]EFO7832439.1 hypothetical protein [Salmonella enterica]